MTLDLESLAREAAAALGWSAVTLEPMAGATSAAVFAVRGAQGEAVLRIFDAERWAPETPAELSRRETAILEALSVPGLKTPKPLARLKGNGVIMTRLPGAVWLPDQPQQRWLEALALALCRIHAAPIELPTRYRSWNGQLGRPPPPWWSDAALWEAVQQRLKKRPEASAVLLHRDYHPTNVLWEAGRVSGIVDWINACMGPAQVDVAHCRLNLALMYGTFAADAFLDAYRRAVPAFRYEGFWDLDGALSASRAPVPYPPWAEFGLHGITTSAVRSRLLAFVARAADNG